jgi:hypothetical protein
VAFWHAVNTFKDLRSMEAVLERGNAPWQVWRKPGGDAEPGVL